MMTFLEGVNSLSEQINKLETAVYELANLNKQVELYSNLTLGVSAENLDDIYVDVEVKNDEGNSLTFCISSIGTVLGGFEFEGEDDFNIFGDDFWNAHSETPLNIDWIRFYLTCLSNKEYKRFLDTVDPN